MIKPEAEKNIKLRFETVHRNVNCLHSPGEAMAIAKAILDEPAKGPVVECGCFQGGMTCKLSIACRIAGKELHVYDTFQGLPDSETARCFESNRNKDGNAGIKEWVKGSMSGSLDEVMDNVRKYGEISVCRFHPGKVQQTLPMMEYRPSTVFIDVDLRDAARTCVKYLWPRLEGRYFFTHEMWFKDYVENITDREWWLENMGEPPPELIGAETGMEEQADDLGYFLKTPKPANSHP